ncbi:hypothetical protein [Miltoncostaea marina]|uniref:hypothetical protein n=1 Tax=Miltoncostaea marina TaxID=2843215 RepID=UPI001C3E1D1D|nr:hypothetical protein [Miltoncostaea marina]
MTSSARSARASLKSFLVRTGVAVGWAGVALAAWLCAEIVAGPAPLRAPWGEIEATMPAALAVFVALAALGAAFARRSPVSAMAPFYVTGSVGFAFVGAAWLLPGLLLLVASFAIMAGLDA